MNKDDNKLFSNNIYKVTRVSPVTYFSPHD